jgi:hypothetical protein
MAGEETGVGVKAAARSDTDDDSDRPAAIEGLGLVLGGRDAWAQRDGEEQAEAAPPEPVPPYGRRDAGARGDARGPGPRAP